ncbi:MAG: DUF4263 domain-containing protein [Dehalococcoidia bacterium]|nr:DUF4263 domain-containing protein [Dehalococcoidia bacterium]
MPDDYDYFMGRRADRTYFSKLFASGSREMRFAYKTFDSSELHQIVDVENETVLRITDGQRQEVKALFYEDSRNIECLTIQRYTKETGKPHQKSHFTFRGEEITKFLKFIHLIRLIQLDKPGKERLDDKTLDDYLFGESERRRYLLDHLDLVMEVAKNNITKSDITALAYRKKQLERFEELLQREETENTWQKFFESNPWIFGYGLNYIFTSSLDDQKLEQVTTGYSISGAGKRVDALMKTRGLISSLCFVEIKTHKTLLLSNKPYRTECWRISTELAGSISQIQRTVQKAIESIRTRLDIETNRGEPTGEAVFLYQPRAFVVVGSLDEFRTGQGTNEQRFSSFELFRRNMVSPEVITFDELFERARFIVRHSEEEESFAEDDDDAGTGIAADDDIPF